MSSTDEAEANRLTHVLLALWSSEKGLTWQQIVSTVPGYGEDTPATQRRFMRDRQALATFGVVVETVDRSDHSAPRYRIRHQHDSGEDLPLVSLTSAQWAAVSLAVSAWRDNDLPSTAITALTKLQAALNTDSEAASQGCAQESNGGQNDEEWLSQFYPRAPHPLSTAVSSALSLDFSGHELSGAILDAVATHSLVSFDYRSLHSGDVRRRIVKPEFLWIAERAWYMRGYDHTIGHMRTFRLTRIVGQVTLVDEEMLDDSDFMPGSSEHKDQEGKGNDHSDDLTTLYVAVNPGAGWDLRKRAQHVFYASGSDIDPGAEASEHPVPTPRPQAMDVLKICTATPAQVAGEVAKLGDRAVALDPPTFVDLVIDHLRGVLALKDPASAVGKTEAAGQYNSNFSGLPSVARGEHTKRNRGPNREADTLRRLALLSWLTRHPDSSVSQVAQTFGMTQQDVRRDVMTLWAAGRSDATWEELLDFDAEAFEHDRLRVTQSLGLEKALRLTRREIVVIRLSLAIVLNLLGPHGGAPFAEADRALARALREGDTASEDAFDTSELCEQNYRDHSEPERGSFAEAVHPAVWHTMRQVQRELAQAQTPHSHGSKLGVHVLQLEYIDATDNFSARRVDPLEIMSYGSHMLLRGWCHLARAERMFRWDRMVRATLTNELVRRRRSTPSRESVGATVHLSSQGRWVAEYVPYRALREHADGSLTLVIEGRNARWLISFILSCGRAIIGVEPQWLLQECQRLASRALTAYGTTPLAEPHEPVSGEVHGCG